MNLALTLPWFPIILAVGVGGRLLGRTRGLALGILCALFWTVLVQATSGVGMWQDPWTVATLVAGAVAIAAMGCWSGDVTNERVNDEARDARSPSSGGDRSTNLRGDLGPFVALSAAVERFDDWLEAHRDAGDPWPRFDEFIRTTLSDCCQASHVRPYRLLADTSELAPLRGEDPLADTERLSSRKGIVGHVVTTGRSYLAGDNVQGELVEHLAEATHAPPAWCFAVRHGTRRLGVVVVGELALAPEPNAALLQLVERLVNQFWRTLVEALDGRSAKQVDPASGLRTRQAFVRSAEAMVIESYERGEPVAVAVLALEGVRKINDSGRWALGDELLRRVGDALKRKVRMDDCLGRFDGSRFVLLLRRVDSQLAALILSQIVTQVRRECEDEGRWGGRVVPRCGLAGSGGGQPPLRDLVTAALAECQRAREQGVTMANDVDGEPVDTTARA